MKKWLVLCVFLAATVSAAASDPLSLALPDARLCLYSRFGPVLKTIIDEQTAPRAVDSSIPPVSAAYTAGKAWGFNWKNEIQQKVGKKTVRESAAAMKTEQSRLLSTLVFLRDRFKFVPDELWLYVRDSSEFLIIVSGDIEPANWRCLFSPERLINRGKGFSVGSRLQNSRENPILLHVTPGYLMVFPSNLEGTVLDALAGAGDRISDKWNTFVKMAGMKPLLALELDSADTAGSSSSLGAPFPLSEVQRFRCLIGRDLTKLQAFLVHDDARTLLLSQIIDVMREIAAPPESTHASINEASMNENPLPGAIGALKAKIQGQSVFLEGPGLQQNHSLAAAAAIGVIDSILSRHLPADLLPLPTKSGLQASTLPTP